MPWLDAEPTVQSAHAPVDVPGDAALVSRATCRGNWSMQTPYRALPRASIAGERAVARDDARTARAAGRGGGGGDHDDGATTAAVAWASAGAAVVALLALAALAVALWRRKRRQKEIRALSLAIESDVMMGAAERAVLGSPHDGDLVAPVARGRARPRHAAARWRRDAPPDQPHSIGSKETQERRETAGRRRGRRGRHRRPFEAGGATRTRAAPSSSATNRRFFWGSVVLDVREAAEDDEAAARRGGIAQPATPAATAVGLLLEHRELAQ